MLNSTTHSWCSIRDRMQVHLIDALPAVVWDACDGSTLVADLAAEIASLTDISADAADTAVREALDQFASMGLLVGSTAVSLPP